MRYIIIIIITYGKCNSFHACLDVGLPTGFAFIGNGGRVKSKEDICLIGITTRHSVTFLTSPREMKQYRERAGAE